MFLSRSERRSVWQWIGFGILIVAVLSMVGWGLRWLLLPAKIIDPDEGLKRWRWFYEQIESINATESNIYVATEAINSFLDLNGLDPEEWGWQTKDEYARLQSIYMGYIVHYNSLVNEYNAKMRDITVNWASPPDLPERIPQWVTP